MHCGDRNLCPDSHIKCRWIFVSRCVLLGSLSGKEKIADEVGVDNIVISVSIRIDDYRGSAELASEGCSLACQQKAA